MAIARVASWALPVAARAERVTFADLVRDHQDEVFGLALRMLGDRDAAMDVTSTVFLKAYRAFDRFDRSRPPRPWLLRIAVNEAISAGRQRTRDLAHRAPADDALELPDRAPVPEDEALAREERGRVRDAVARLAEPYRTVTVLRYFSGLAVDEVAEITGRPASTVGVQLMRARALLRADLGGQA
jgi:RNA polymerase sigma factor (sigma-70 family)